MVFDRIAMAMGLIAIEVGWIAIAMDCIVIAVAWFAIAMGLIAIEVGLIVITMDLIPIAVGWIAMAIGLIIISVAAIAIQSTDIAFVDITLRGFFIYICWRKTSNMKKLFTLLAIAFCLYAGAQCASSYEGTYRVRHCGADTTSQCTATIKLITPTKILISHFACIPYSVIGAVDTIYADLHCSTDSLFIENVSYYIIGVGGLYYSGNGIMTTDSLKINYYQVGPGGPPQYVCYVYDNHHSLGIQLLAVNSQISVYPNPATTSLQVSFSGTNTNTTLVLTDMLGNVVKQVPLNTQYLTFNIAELSEGIYNLSLQNSEGMVNKRVVIVR